MPKDDDDLRLLEHCLRGAPGAWEDFVARFTPLVDWVVRRTIARAGPAPDRARVEDLRQEAFLALCRDDSLRLRRFQPSRGRLAAWVGMIARETVLRHLSKTTSHESTLLHPETIPAPPAPDGKADRLCEALEDLPPREALCLRLLLEQDLPGARVATILGVSRGRVYQIREAALARLREALRKSGDSP